MIRKGRILFANPEVGKVGQPNGAPEDKEVEEGPREKGWFDLSSHKKKRKQSKKKCWILYSLQKQVSIHQMLLLSSIWTYED